MRAEDKQRLEERRVQRKAAGLPRKAPRKKSSVESALIRPGDCAALLGVCRLTLYRWEKTLPGFPKRKRLSPSVSGWMRSEITAWLKDRGPTLDEPDDEVRSA